MTLLNIPDQATSQTYTVTSPQSVFPFSFAVFAKTDLHFMVGSTELAQSDFTLSGTLLDGGGYQGGTITLNAPVTFQTCLLWRETSAARGTNFSPAPTVPVRDIDVQFNRFAAALQDVRRDLASGGISGGVDVGGGSAVSSVNGRVGAVVLTSTDVGAMPVTGGTFSGPVMATTPTPSDNTTKLATTAFVANAVSSIGGGVTLATTGTPANPGTAALGVGTHAAREDHVHNLPTLSALGAAEAVMTTKGDLYGFSSVPVRVAVGTNGQILKADSTQASGLAWGSYAYASLTGIPSTFAPTAHTHVYTDVTNFSAGVNANLTAGTNITLSYSGGATTITAAGGSFGPGAFPLANHNDYQFGSLDPLGTSEPGRSFFNLARSSSLTSSGNENVLCVQAIGSGPDSTLYGKQAALFQVLTTAGASAADFVAGAIPGGVAVYASGFLNGVAGGKFGSVWGAVAETSVITGYDGAAYGIETGTYINTVGQENANIDLLHKNKINITAGAARSGFRSTAVLMSVSNASTNGAFFYGAVLQDISTSFLLFRAPRTGAVAVDVRPDTRWGDVMRGPAASRIARYNAAGSGAKNVVQWDDASSAIAIGDTGDSILIQIPGVGQRTITVGAANSGGAGFRQLLVAN